MLYILQYFAHFLINTVNKLNKFFISLKIKKLQLIIYICNHYFSKI